MKQYAAALALVLCLTLTACGVREDNRGQGLFQRTSGVEEDAVLLTVDGREVPAWRYFYWLERCCGRLREQYRAAGLTLDWNAPVEGGTLADYVKDQALADTALYATVENWADFHGCALDEEDQAALEAAWAEKTAEYGGEKAYLQALAEMGLDRARMEELTGVGRLYAKLYSLYCQEGSALAPEPEALEAFAVEQGRITVDQLFFAAGEDREAARQRAAEAFARLNAAEDLAAEFAVLAAEVPEEFDTFALGDGALEETLEAAAQALEAGQCSGILETGEGLSILFRVEADKSGVEEEYFDHLLQEAAENAAVQLTEAYQALDPADFSAGLVRAG
ncbi:peptidylprolyl isomerase [uncultured Oscillibacter sp.]|uniref:peptidylprolyl isomerase n=1 Tax=uncultured Oscillibacter sp. TaxID=876091 RepID=UPI0026189624|nr:peptidylprolyl isomerase [uncultured Oscillibacter sp.]